MVLFNHATREMTAKIVYYGPGLCGKTTNLLVIFDKLDPKTKGKMLSLATKTDRTLFFDLLPVDIGKVGNFNLKIQLYTVPGQVFYNETRKLVLKGADSVVFVADSQPTMVESTRESFANLLENLEQNQLDPNDIPIVVQYNKRDLPGVLPVDELQEALGLDGYPYVEAAAINGTGVMETFKLATKITAKHLITRLQGKSTFPEVRKASKKIETKESPSGAPQIPKAREPEVVQEIAAEPPVNPFADSVPFGDNQPMDEGYEAMEEVSLEQLLEGRDRPLTFSGTVPIPVMPYFEQAPNKKAAPVVDEEEEIEELDAGDIITEEPPAAVEVSASVVSPEVEEPPLDFGVTVDELPVSVADSTASFVADHDSIPEMMIDEPLPEPVVQTSGDTGRLHELEAKVTSLEGQLERLRSEHKALLRAISRGLGDLAELIEPALLGNGPEDGE